MLEKEFKYFQAHQDELVKKYANRYIVIVAEDVIGDYATESEAYGDASKKHSLGTFLIQHCIPGNDAFKQTYHSRVIFA